MPKDRISDARPNPCEATPELLAFPIPEGPTDGHDDFDTACAEHWAFLVQEANPNLSFDICLQLATAFLAARWASAAIVSIAIAKKTRKQRKASRRQKKRRTRSHTPVVSFPVPPHSPSSIYFNWELLDTAENQFLKTQVVCQKYRQKACQLPHRRSQRTKVPHVSLPPHNHLLGPASAQSHKDSARAWKTSFLRRRPWDAVWIYYSAVQWEQKAPAVVLQSARGHAPCWP